MDSYKTIVKCFLMIILCSTSSFAQQILKGKITDSESGQALPGASIGIKGTSTGATTDGNGNFRLTVPTKTSVLVFSYVGYINQEVIVGNRKIGRAHV